MTRLDQWAARWGVPPQALAELRQALAARAETGLGPIAQGAGTSEAAALTRERLAMSERGGRLWRNNVGAGRLENGSFVRWGLCNESEQMNRQIKSSDLIGIQPRMITPDLVGQTIGQFVAREVKRPGWRFTGSPREQGQLRFIELVQSLGGDAAFTTGE